MEDVWFSAVSQHWREYMTTRMHPTGLDGCSTSPPFLHRSVSYFCVLTNNITIPQLTCPQQWMLVILSHHFIVFQWRCVNVLCRLIFGALSTNTKVPTSSSVLQKKGKKSCTKIIKMNEQHYILEERHIPDFRVNRHFDKNDISVQHWAVKKQRGGVDDQLVTEVVKVSPKMYNG